MAKYYINMFVEYKLFQNSLGRSKNWWRNVVTRRGEDQVELTEGL